MSVILPVGTSPWLSSAPASTSRGCMSANPPTMPQCYTPVMSHSASWVCVSVDEIHFLIWESEHSKCFFLSQHPQLSTFHSSGWCWSRRTNWSATQRVSTLLLSLSPGPGMEKTFCLPTPVKAIQPQMATTLLLPTWPYILPGRIRMWPLVAMSGIMAANRSYVSNLISHVSHFSQPPHEKGSGQGTNVQISLLRPCFSQTFSPTIALRQYSRHTLLRRGQFLSWGCFGDLPSKWHSPSHPTCHREEPQRDLQYQPLLHSQLQSKGTRWAGAVCSTPTWGTAPSQ